MKKFLNGCLFVVSLFWTVTPLSAQPGNAEPVTEAELKELVEQVNQLLLDNYVFPEKAEEMAALLRKNLQAGEYNSLKQPRQLATRLTEDLRSITQDRHLHVDFGPERVARMRERMNAPDEEPTDMLDNMRFSNYGFQEVKILSGNVGYLDLRGFIPAQYGGETAAAAMNFLSGADALIIDLRRNGGGSPSMIQLLTSYLYDQDETVHLNNFYWRPEDRTTQTWTLPYVPGKKLGDVPVYVLTSNNTFSAAEEFTYNLRNLERATIVGETTGGGAHPGGTRVATDRFTVWIPSGRAINPITNTNWEGVGVEPHVKVEADKALDKAHHIALEKLMENAPEGQSERYAWELPVLQTKLSPVTIEEELLRSYAGKYEVRTLSFDKGQLYYQREGNTKHVLVPLAKDLFMIPEVPYFRIQIVKEGPQVVGLRGLYENGQEDYSARSGS